MSYKYNSCRDVFEHIPDESSISIDKTTQSQIYQTVYVADECIEKIAEAVVKKLRGNMGIKALKTPNYSCNTCGYNNLEWYEEPCDSCTMGGETNYWKPLIQKEGGND